MRTKGGRWALGKPVKSGAEGFDLVVVAEVEVFGLGVGPGDQLGIEGEEIGAVPGGGVGVGRVGGDGAGGEQAVGPLLGSFAGIDLAHTTSPTTYWAQAAEPTDATLGSTPAMPLMRM